jgi:hypothetical protein
MGLAVALDFNAETAVDEELTVALDEVRGHGHEGQRNIWFLLKCGDRQKGCKKKRQAKFAPERSNEIRMERKLAVSGTIRRLASMLLGCGYGGDLSLCGLPSSQLQFPFNQRRTHKNTMRIKTTFSLIIA